LLQRLAIAFLLFNVGCRKASVENTVNWTSPQPLSQSQDSLISSFSLHKWNNSLLALNADSGTLEVFVLDDNGQSWVKEQSRPLDWLPVALDSISNRWVAAQATLSGGTAAVEFRLGRFTPGAGFAVETRELWRADKSAVFATSPPEASFGGSAEKPLQQPFWGAVFHDSTICMPYCLRGETRRGKTIFLAEGPFDNGIFYSTDNGSSWRREHIDSAFCAICSVGRTERFLYFLGGRTDTQGLWFSARPVDGGEWSQPAPVVKENFATWSSAVAEGDTIHLCWLDRRNEKRRVSPVYPWGKNYQVAYCQRQDSDSRWSEQIIISKGLEYAYRPVMSVEGSSLVIAWSGVRSAPDGHDENSPNDIYYATSNDGGKRWSNPLRVTDNVSSKLTAGCPQVALRHGVIYLFYIRGQINYTQVSAGMVKLNQPPWPIFVTQRPFPNPTQ
jgi:hypothetical protein